LKAAYKTKENQPIMIARTRLSALEYVRTNFLKCDYVSSA
jgi:hypothetical protein